MNCKKVKGFLVDQLKNYLLNESPCKGFTVGVSGGIDSALVSTLCAETRLPTICVTMPIHQAADQVARGDEHILWLQKKYSNIEAVNVDLTKPFDEFVLSLPPSIQKNALALVNARARLRMTTLYTFGNLVVGTGNRVEDFGVGFFTKYGDGGVDISPIGDLFKTEVFEISKFLGICSSILVAKPTDGLWDDNRSDEDQLGASYPDLEWAMRYCEKKGYDFDYSKDGSLNDHLRKIIGIYLDWHRKGEHKMRMPRIFYIPEDIKVEL